MNSASRRNLLIREQAPTVPLSAAGWRLLCLGLCFLASPLTEDPVQMELTGVGTDPISDTQIRPTFVYSTSFSEPVRQAVGYYLQEDTRRSDFELVDLAPGETVTRQPSRLRSHPGLWANFLDRPQTRRTYITWLQRVLFEDGSVCNYELFVVHGPDPRTVTYCRDPIDVPGDYYARAMVAVSATPQGRVERVRMDAGTGVAAVDAAILEAIRDWRFSPSGRAGDVHVEYRYITHQLVWPHNPISPMGGCGCPAGSERCEYYQRLRP